MPGALGRAAVLRHGSAADMARLPDLVPSADPAFWTARRWGARRNLTAVATGAGGGTRRPDGNGRRAQVEYLSPAHLAETDAHAQRTRDRLAEFDPALVAAIGAAVAQDLAFFAGVFDVA